MRFKKLQDHAIVPTLEHDGESIGYDLYSCEKATLPAVQNQREIIEQNVAKIKQWREFSNITPVHTGIASEIPVGHAGLFWSRSSYGIGGIEIAAGVIDPGYRGELVVCLINLNPFRVHIPSGSKIAQMVIVPVVNTAVELVDELSDSQRGEKGFGSTGG